MQEIACSFCGTTMSKDEAKNNFVAGPDVFICRGCVEMCLDIFSRDAAWRDRQIAKLRDSQVKPQNSN
jgi:ATP-dependent protease Clp ATPase subunit